MRAMPEEPSDVVIGIDVGTTSVRCCVYSLKGHLRSTSSVSVIVSGLYAMCKSEFQLDLQKDDVFVFGWFQINLKIYIL